MVDGQGSATPRSPHARRRGRSRSEPGDDGVGEFGFIVVWGWMDCRPGGCVGRGSVQFTWHEIQVFKGGHHRANRPTGKAVALP